MSIVQDLQKTGYSFVKISKADLNTIKEFEAIWEQFVRFPRNQKEKILYQNGGGYEFKAKGVTFDEKENFHLKHNDYKRIIDSTVGSDTAFRGAVGVYLQFGLGTLEIYKKIMLDVAGELQHLVECDIKSEIEKSSPNWPQRSLFYLPGQSDSTIADSHPDKGFITIGSFASCRGLQICNPKTMEWESVSIPYQHVLIMPGIQSQILTNSKIKALWHRVVNSPESVVNGRFSQVVFCDLDGQPKYNKEKYGSTQEKDVGFNYCIDHDTFLKEVL